VTSSVVVLGGGLAGLSAAYHLKEIPARVFEKSRYVGGTARSFQINGFTFDITGHLLHLHNPYTKKLVAELLKGNVYRCIRNTQIFSEGKYTRYPYQAYTRGLPEETIDACVLGCVEALTKAQTKKIDPAKLDFGAWSRAQFGDGIASKFMKPYNEKLYQVPVSALNTDWCGAFVPQPDLADVVRGALNESGKEFGYNATFLYPRQGGIQFLAERLAERVGEINFNTAASRVDWKKKSVRFDDGTSARYDRLISTLPLPELLDRMSGLPADVRRARRQLKWASIVCVNLGVRRSEISKASWIYFPEPKYIFYRVGFPMNFTPHVVPEGCSSMYVEVPMKAARLLNENALLARVKKDLVATGILRSSDTFAVTQLLPIKYAYVIYDKNRRSALDVIFRFLKKNKIQSIGRYGAWKYSFMEEAILDGKMAADAIRLATA
jgi:protoporphyrinogen oxidase